MTITVNPTGLNLPQKNFLIGGNFEVNPWQRGTSFASPVDGDYTADRFSWRFSGAGAVTITKNADAPTVSQADFFTQYSLRVAVTTADASIAAGDFYAVRYVMEGYDFVSLAQRQFTVSFWVRSTVTGTYCVGFRNSGGDKSYVHEYTVDSSDTWEYKEFTVTASPSAGTWAYTNGIGLLVDFAIACGSTYGSGTNDTWTDNNMFATTNQANGMSSTSNIFSLALVKIEEGPVSTPYPLENFVEMMNKCQRYCYSILPNGSTTDYFYAVVADANTAYMPIRLPTQMRAAPSLVASSATASNFSMSYVGGTGGGVCTSVPSLVGTASANYAEIVFTTSSHGLTANYGCRLNGSPSLWLTAEL